MDGSFGEGRPEGRMGGGRVPPGALMAAIGKLRGEGAPDGLRLTPEQEDQFRDLHEQIGSMRSGPRGGGGGDAKAERQRMADRVQDVQTKAFAILNDKQKDFVKGEIEKARKDAENRMDEQRVRRKLGERGQPGQPPEGARPGDPPPPGAWWRMDGAGPQGPEGASVPRERLRHIAELLGRLSPEEREQFLSRIERALEERAQRGRDDAAPPPEGDRPPEGARLRRARPSQPPQPEQSDQPRPRRNPPG
jgi:hypothetical protein